MLWSGLVATNVHPFQLRVPLDLWESLERAATTNERSMQREITFRLRKSFQAEAPEEQTIPKGPPETLHLSGKETSVPTDMTDIRGEPISVSLPDREVRHSQCLKRTQHHIYHGGRPCPLCGYPT